MESSRNILNRRVSRRLFLAGGIACGALSIPMAYANDTSASIELVKRKVPIRDLPPEFAGYRIGFLTDPHVGTNVPFEWFDQAIDLIADANLDLLLLGGDFIAINDSVVSKALQQNRNRELRGRSQFEHPAIVYTGIAARLGRIRPRDGTFAVLGNHDCWVSPTICTRAFTPGGIDLLVNELRTIRRGQASLQLYGTDDYWNGIPSVKGLPPPSNSKTELRILLTHNPDFASLVLEKKAATFQLSLSGHTHGGQIRLPGIGALYYNIDDLRFAEGLYTRPDGTQCYTSRGIGVVEIPFRLNCPAEATILELIAA